ncbi:MAG: NUDIX hydrolase [Patescibacteria group bacterium]|jgi:8-oxo-dGTP pyrophosphatase MutT (NUDIX family)
MIYKHFSAGYLVRNDRVLLVHHKKFDKWTPPGGHIEEGETPDQALKRECKEEVGLDIEVLPAYPSAFAGDANATPIPMPFHIDLEREGFSVPHIGHFFYVKLAMPDQDIKIELEEIHNAGWFSKEDLKDLLTFDQVRALAAFAIDHYPKLEESNQPKTAATILNA